MKRINIYKEIYEYYNTRGHCDNLHNCLVMLQTDYKWFKKSYL